MAVFDTPRTTGNSDKALLEMVRTKMHRRNNMRVLTEEAEAKVDSEKTMKELEKIDADSDAKKALEDKIDDRKERVAKEALSRAKIGMQSRLYESGCKQMFNTTIFEMAYNACWIDDPVKESNLKAMYETFNKVIETLESVGIHVDMESNVTPFITNVRKIVNEACSKTAKRIVEDCCIDGKNAKDIDEIEFTMNTDEFEELANSLNDLGKEDIEELVKHKVLAVVQDERDKAREKAEEIEEIKAAQAEEPEEDLSDEEIAAEESFNALVQRSRNMKNYRKIGSSLFECVMMSNTNELRKTASAMEAAVPETKVMDVALQESVLVYTILETLNTLKLCEFNNINVNKLCNHYRSTLR